MRRGQAPSLFLALCCFCAQLPRKNVGCDLLVCASGFSSNFIMKMLLHQIQMTCQQKCRRPFLCVSRLSVGPLPAWDSVKSAGVREWPCHTSLIFMDMPALSFLFLMRNSCEAVSSMRAGTLSASPVLYPSV